MVLTLNESVFDKVKDFFGKTVEGEAKESIYNWIQIFRQQCLDKKYIHYELIDNHIELHFEIYSKTEDYRKDDDIVALIDYLKEKLKEDNEYKWDYWGRDNNEYRCQYVEELNEGNYLEITKEFVEKMDFLIDKFKYNPDEKTEIETTGDVTLVELSLKDVFDLNLSIPDYQRIYCWEDKQVNDLWKDLIEIPNEKYHLGAIILHQKDNKYNIVDGQQRLVTLTIFLLELGYFGSLPLLKESFLSQDAQTHIGNTKAIVNYKKNEINNNTQYFIDKITSNIVFSVLILKDKNLALAHTFFSNQNSKGVALTDFDLLKAHHLRYIYVPEEQEHLAKQWNKLTKENDEAKVAKEGQQPKEYGPLDKAMGTHLCRLRNWMRKRDYDEKKHLRVRDEFSVAPIMKGIPPFGEKFNFYEKIQGGSHFFAYVNHFLYLYKNFVSTPQVTMIRNYFGDNENYTLPRYGSVIETLLFAYFLKFGAEYLSEALFCIAGVMDKHRYDNNRAECDKIRAFAKNSEIVMMIDQATSPTFFLAEALNKVAYISNCNNVRPSKEIFNNIVKKIMKELLPDFTDKTITEIIKKEFNNER